MPLYEYQCSACAHRFERIVKFSDPPVKTCPRCGQQTVEQLLSAPAVQFKGSGWYVTDYARKSSTPTASSPAKSEGAKDSGSSSSEAGATPPASPSTAPSSSPSSGATSSESSKGGSSK